MDEEAGMPPDIAPRTGGFATPDGAAAATATAVARATAAVALGGLAKEIAACRACPRLVAWREAAAVNPPARFRGERYWARPVPGWGDAAARIVLVGLAPAAHGGNRTGRVFTGDRSGDFLFAALHRAGLASQPTSTRPGDGLELRGAYVAAAVRCAPPANAPTPEERDRCAPFLHRELALLVDARVIVALGAFGWVAALRAVEATSGRLARPLPRFGHAAEAAAGPFTLLGTFHPSQQNTFTGRLTAEMLDAVLARAVEVASAREHSERPGGLAVPASALPTSQARHARRQSRTHFG
jgi:uracil-DNA glycosylase family 4